MALTSSKGYNSSFRGSQAPGAYYQVLTADFGVVQPSLPSVLANETFDYCFVVPNTGSDWRVQKTAHVARPDGTIDTAGISISSVDILSPVYPGTSQTLTGKALLDAATTPAIFCCLNGYLYQATNTSSGTTASTFIGSGAFNQTKGATTTDGTVTWTSWGKAQLVVLRFVNSTASPATPAAMEYDLWAS